MPVDYQLLKTLPKTDLHCHLDGSLRPSTVADFLRDDGRSVPSDLEQQLKVSSSTTSLPDYLKSFELPCSLLQSSERLERTAYELVEDCSKENICHLEVRFAPFLHCEGGLQINQVIDSVLCGLQSAGTEFSISTGLILTGLRHVPPSQSMLLAEKVAEYWGRGVVALDLAGAERGNPPKNHLEAFYFVRNHNINLTVHAGEDFGPKSIHQAIHYCGAHRIGHGVRLLEDENLLEYINDHRIPLEICLTSNLQTGAVTSLEEHPLPEYFQRGLRVSLNTDNRTVSDTTITDEFFLATTNYQLNLEDVKRLIINGFKSAFLSYREKSRLLHKVVKQLDSISEEN